MTAAVLTDRGRRTRESLLAAAREVFEAKGVAATRMGDIADAAGVSHGTVYTYFASKDDVLQEVVAELGRDIRRGLRVGAEEADPVTRIAEANRRFLATYAQHAGMLGVIDQVAASDPRYRQLYLNMRQGYVQRAVAGIRRLQADGRIDPQLDAQIAGSALCCMVEGFARNWFGSPHQADPAAVTDTLTQLWARALGLPSRSEAPDSPDQTAPTVTEREARNARASTRAVH